MDGLEAEFVMVFLSDGRRLEAFKTSYVNYHARCLALKVNINNRSVDERCLVAVLLF